ncbi:MAG TPA: hypothetical protein VGQ35_19750 [Dongiaceae bacterium]|jgi:hypothetical protein|nr:hypothetical protein [Dongiaceae bacterium]
MSDRNQENLFAPEPQADLFGAESAPAYRPDPDKVRARLNRILAETRARTVPWDIGRASLYRTIFPQLTLWLPEDEAAQLRLEFETEMERLQSASA